MMLNVKENWTITGTSEIDGKVMQRYSATINPEAPDPVSLSEVIIDKDGYRDNREECHKDAAEFEDVVYEAQAEMIKTNAVKGETA